MTDLTLEPSVCDGISKLVSVHNNGREVWFRDQDGILHWNPPERCWQAACREQGRHVRTSQETA